MINFSKTNYMIFKPRNRIIDENLIKHNINNNEINRVTNVKVLGIKIDNKLTWKDHVNEMSQKNIKCHWHNERIKIHITYTYTIYITQ